MDDSRLVAKVVLVRADGTVTVTRLLSDRVPDLSMVDLVARMALAARRARARMHVAEVCPGLARLLELAGVVELVGLRPVDREIDDSPAAAASYPPSEGGAMSTSTPTIRVKQILTVGIPVTDQDRARSFFVDTLGFGLHLDVPIGPGKRWIVVAPPAGTATIALVASTDGLPSGIETGIRLVSTDVGGDHVALKAEGVDVGDILRWEGVPPMFAFRDPDGNGLELVGEA